jgi:hypothetical protein
MNDTALVVGLVAALIGVVYFKFKSNVPKIKELEKEKVATQTKLDAVNAERETLKATVAAEQHNATEEQKQEFWKKELKDE